MATGNKFSPGSTGPGGASSNAGNPLQGAVTNVTNVVGSVTGGLTKSISSAISNATSAAAASTSSHP
jgi:hypothetical protein